MSDTIFSVTDGNSIYSKWLMSSLIYIILKLIYIEKNFSLSERELSSFVHQVEWSN